MKSRKSRDVKITILAIVAGQMVAAGCGPSVVQMQHCVDYYGRMLPDYYCDQPYGYYPSGYGGVYYTGHPVIVYGGSGGYSYGSRIYGYSVRPTNGARIVNSAGTTIGQGSNGTVQRGGFGGSGGGGGGFGGSGGSFGG